MINEISLITKFSEFEVSSLNAARDKFRNSNSYDRHTEYVIHEEYDNGVWWAIYQII